jgi:hypothetical protein
MSRTPQLDLQLSVADSVRLQSDCDYWKACAENLAHENQSLQEALEAAKAQALELERKLIFAETILKTREIQLAMLKHWKPHAPQTGLAKAQLTQLLALVHPDRWQGQPAEALGHELACEINKMRGEASR